MRPEFGCHLVNVLKKLIPTSKWTECFTHKPHFLCSHFFNVGNKVLMFFGRDIPQFSHLSKYEHLMGKGQ